jgi:hypothetical protein
MLERMEQGVSEIALVHWPRMTFDVVPKVLVGHLEHPRQKSQQSSVDRSGEIFGERSDFVHVRVDASRHLVQVLELFVVKIELRDAIGFSFDRLKVSVSSRRPRLTKTHSPPKRRLVTSIKTTLRIPMQAILVHFRNVAVKVMSDAELSM